MKKKGNVSYKTSSYLVFTALVGTQSCNSCLFLRYLELIHSLQLLQIRHQPCAIFESLEKFNLELNHFCQVPKQYIQLEGEKTV